MPQNTLAVPQRSYSLSRLGYAAGLHRDGVPDIAVKSYRLLIHAYYRFFCRYRPCIDLQHVFHLFDVVIVEFGDAPHFFPATAGGRGLATRCEWSRGPTRGTSLRLTASCATIRTVQRA